MKVLLEIFILQIVADRVRYCRREIELCAALGDPDKVVRAMVEQGMDNAPRVNGARYVSHSTSWRHETPGTLVLSYLVCAESVDFGAEPPQELAAEAFALAQSDDPRRPRPATIPAEAVLCHGIRHLGFLHQNGEAAPVAQALSVQAATFLAHVAPALAGRLGRQSVETP